MNTKHSILALIAIATLSGCASNYQQQQPVRHARPAPVQQNAERYGTIDSIQVIRGTNSGTSGVGAVVGGVAGAALGNQVGSGRGRTAATIAGAVGGALVGNTIEQKQSAPAPDSYQIHVRMSNGDGISVTQDNLNGLRKGSRVRIANGRAYAY